MALWVYDENDYEEKSFELIPEGVYRVRIEKAEETVSHSGDKNMIKLTLAVSGYNSKLWRNIILDGSTTEAKKRTNQILGALFSSFGIADHTMNIAEWEGRVGGAKVRHRTNQDTGVTYAEVHYFLTASKVELLAPWQEGKQGSQGVINPEMVSFDEDVTEKVKLDPKDIPF